MQPPHADPSLTSAKYILLPVSALQTLSQIDFLRDLLSAGSSDNSDV